MPDGLIADDLKEPKIWRKVQSEPQSALLKHDHLYLVSHDESWAADAIVTHASGSEVVLSKPRLITFAERTKPFFRDEKYTVGWFGKGYGVKRLSDDQLMTNIVTSEAIAERDLANLYPKPIG